MGLKNFLTKQYLLPRLKRIEYATSHPFEVQEEILMRLLMENQHTEFGKIHHFEDIHTPDQFAKIPVQDYESLKPYILRTYNGEQNLLLHEPIKWFSKSSGTTEDKSKFLPVSLTSLEETHYRAGKDVAALFLNNHPDTNIFDGKCFVLTGSVRPNSENGKAFAGDISGVLIENLPTWVQMLRTPKKEIALIADWEEKMDLICKEIIKENVTYISGVPSWMLVILNRILAETGKSDIREVFPNLELFIHGAVRFEPYKSQFQQIIPHSDMYYYDSYNASEGFFALQDTDEQGEMLLMMDYGIYYEFIPFEELGSANPKTIQLKDVELDRNYALLITTNSGLWRYMIGDTIKFTSLNPFKICITGRTKHFINAFGEEVVIENAEKAIAYACEKNDAHIHDFTVAPIFQQGTQAGAHEWLIEFEKEPSNLAQFIIDLDSHLQKINSDYEAKRKGNYALNLPVIRILPKNTFYSWLKSKGKLGGQHKVPRLSNTRIYVEEIKTMLDAC